MRVILVIFVPLVSPTVLYIIWRTFAPPKFGGSEVIARDQWEPLPWPWLIGCGFVLMLITMASVFLFPEVFGGF